MIDGNSCIYTAYLPIYRDVGSGIGHGITPTFNLDPQDPFVICSENKRDAVET